MPKFGLYTAAHAPGFSSCQAHNQRVAAAMHWTEHAEQPLVTQHVKANHEQISQMDSQPAKVLQTSCSSGLSNTFLHDRLQWSVGSFLAVSPLVLFVRVWL